ncbi:MAG TPA: hypothetical protein VGK73_11365 [Polyangiaceae bacterium]
MLAFYARGDALVAVPGQDPFTFKRPEGAGPEAYDASIDLGPVKRIGREHVPAVVRTNTKGEPEVVTPARSPATEAAWKCDENATPWLARKLKQRVQEKALWPADEHTAAFCNVPFVALKFLPEGEWVEAKAAPPPASQKSTSKPDAQKPVAAGS